MKRALATVAALLALFAGTLVSPSKTVESPIEETVAALPLVPFSWNEDRSINGRNGVSVFKTKWTNYNDGSEFKKIDVQPVIDEDGFHITAAPYSLDAPQSSSGAFRFTSTNKYDIQTRTVRNDQPIGRWKRWLDVTDVPGIMSGSEIVYHDALPQFNADIVIHPNEEYVRNLVVFRSVPNGTDDIEIPFIETPDEGITPITGSGRVGNIESDIGRGYSIERNDFRGVGTERARVWDSADPPHAQRIKIMGKMVNGKLMARKIIPRAFLDSAVYPVFTDTTSTFYPDASPGTTSNDGMTLRISVNESWATIIAGAGNLVDNSSANDNLHIGASSTLNQFARLDRFILTFDTSAIGSSATVSAATLSLYGRTQADDLSITPNTNIYGSTPASNTNFVNADYGQCGSTAYSTAISYAGWTASIYNDFAFNATGISNVSKTGVSKFCFRNANYDVAAVQPTWSSALTSTFGGLNTADNAGTTQDPQLVVTFSTSSPVKALIIIYAPSYLFS